MSAQLHSLFIRSLKHPQVRQLARVCFSEPLIADFSELAPEVGAACFELNDARRKALLTLDREPSVLLEHLAQHCHSPRLGLRFESFWHFFLKHDPATDLIAHNVPVRERGRTLGEFDVLYFCHERQQTVHLELAIKFFMATPAPLKQGDLLSQWLGPNSRDRLDIKWQRMRSHQLALPHKAASQTVLASLGVEALTQETLTQEVGLKGWLFHRHHDQPLHPGLNPDHARGRWCTHSEFLAQENAKHWRYLAKPDWLGGFDEATALKESALALAEKRPVMLINSQEERLMLAPDRWPASIDQQ